MDYQRVEFDFDGENGTEADETIAVNVQIKAAEKILGDHPNWQAFDADDGTGAILCGPPGIGCNRLDDKW